MLSLFLCFSLCEEKKVADFPSVTEFLEGEWDISPLDFSQEGKEENAPYYIEFHTDIVSQKFVGSAWSNQGKEQELSIHQLEDAQLAQFVIFQSDQFSGKVLDFINTGEVITSFTIKPTTDGGFTTKGRLDDNHTFSLNYYNQTYIRLFVTSNGESSIQEYVVSRPKAVASEPFFGKYQKIAYILGGVFVVQLSLLACCMCSKKKLTDKLEEASGTKLKKVKQD